MAAAEGLVEKKLSSSSRADGSSSLPSSTLSSRKAKVGAALAAEVRDAAASRRPTPAIASRCASCSSRCPSLRPPPLPFSPIFAGLADGRDCGTPLADPCANGAAAPQARLRSSAGSALSSHTCHACNGSATARLQLRSCRGSPSHAAEVDCRLRPPTVIDGRALADGRLASWRASGESSSNRLALSVLLKRGTTCTEPEQWADGVTRGHAASDGSSQSDGPRAA